MGRIGGRGVRGFCKFDSVVVWTDGGFFKWEKRYKDRIVWGRKEGKIRSLCCINFEMSIEFKMKVNMS